MCTSCDWQQRERDRFNSGVYKPVPAISGIVYLQDHYVHLSVDKENTDMIAYTPSEDHGKRDRQTRIKFGKYLRKVFPDMPDSEIQTAVSQFRSKLALVEQPAKLYFTTDREIINAIFETQMCACDSTMISCMHGKWDGDKVRPYHVYAGSPDVAVAYVMVGERIVSRSVVSIKDKRWIRCYSVQGGDSAVDCATLKGFLKAEGYTKGSLAGNRLTRLDTEDVMLPYLDGSDQEVVEDGKWWKVVSGDGDYTADNTDGTGSTGVVRCSECNEPEEDCTCSYCECCEERYADGCERCSFCSVCNGCTEHDGCSCVRCEDCGELVDPPRYTDGCTCDRCVECNHLVDHCECEEEEEEESNVTGDVTVSTTGTV